MKKPSAILVACLSASSCLTAADWKFDDPTPQRYSLSARASEIDPRVKAYPEIKFLIDKEDGKPADLQKASVDTSVAPTGQLVIWLMGHNEELFKRLNSYGHHAIQPHYANGWFSVLCQDKNLDPQARGDVRLEAATGEDFSPELDLAKPDGMMERSYQMVKWLSQKNPQGRWEWFLNKEGTGLDWTKVIISGSSHGSTTAARFAKHVEVARVVALCGPRDQDQDWQSLPSVTPANRTFAFSHTLDGGWTGDHYCRSWEMLGLHQFGPIVDVDVIAAPYGNSRRLITSFDVAGDPDRAHGSVTPGKSSYKDAEGKYLHEDVWRYLFTHSVDTIGEPAPLDPECDHAQGR